jgi:hypothetical protein
MAAVEQDSGSVSLMAKILASTFDLGKLLDEGPEEIDSLKRRGARAAAIQAQHVVYRGPALLFSG